MHLVGIVNGVLVGAINQAYHSSNNINNKHHYTNNKTKANLTWIPTQNNHKMPTMDKCKEKIRGMGVVVPKIIFRNLLREITINIKEGMKSNHL